MKTILLLTTFIVSTVVSAQNGMYDICPIKNSEDVPNSEIYSTSGEKLNLDKVVSEQPTVLVFFRGGWCPYCTRHLSALQEAKSAIDSLGFELIAISPDHFSKLDSVSARSGELDYTLVSDYNANAIRDFGIGWQVDEKLYNKYKDSYGIDVEWWSGSDHHILPVPAVYIVKNGKILLQHVDPNYSKRLSSELLIAMLKDALGE